MKNLLTPLAAACLIASAPYLSASPFTGLYVFGDSLSDAGQFPDAGGPAGATLRFTNRVGPTYQNGSGEIKGETAPMILGQQLGLGPQTPSTSVVYQVNGWADGNNWATGGYTTGQILNSIVAPGGSNTGFRARDGYLISTAGRADANALYYVNGGGNDFLQGLVVSPGTAQAAAGRLVDSVEALQGAGARYIMVSLLPDLGSTPFNGGANPGASFLTGVFNTELVSQLQGINAQIIPLNNPLLLSEVMANPGIYGFDATQNLAATCFEGCFNATWGINSATPDPSKLMFNDAVHPTTAVQQIAADYAYSLIEAPRQISLLPEMAMGNLRSHQGQLRNQWQADWENWQAVDEWRGFLVGGGQRMDFDSQGSSPSADGNGYSFNIGTSLRLDESWRVGAAIAGYQQNIEAGSANSEYDVDSYVASAFAQYQENRWWADLALSGGSMDYDNLKRKMYLGSVKRTEKGNTDGDLWAASARLGYDIAQPGSEWHLSPFLSGDYARVNVDGYTEDGSRSTTLKFDDQHRDSNRLGAGLQGRLQLNTQTALFAEYSFQREYEDDASKVTSELVSIPGIDYKLDGYTPGDTLNSATLGVSHQLTEELSLRGAYSYGKEDDQTLQGINLSLALDW